MKKNRTYGLMENIGLLKMIKIMRFTIFILFFSLSQAFAVDSYSQQTKLSLDLKNAKVEDVLDKIEKSSEFFFMYNKGMVDVERRVDIQIEEKGINQILDKVFENTGISYSIKDRQILLINNSMVNNGAENITQQQQKSVSGKVTDSTGASLPGVSVVVKGTSIGVITDVDGKYLLSKVPENAALLFSFVGMKTQELAIEGKTIINVTLAEESIGLDEVVAIGYGTQKKKDITGSVASISDQSFADMPMSNLSQALVGQIPGLDVVSSGNNPGDGDQIRLRGQRSFVASNDPLIILDGISFNGSINDINPYDIKSVDVLKDASSTAIYGSLGANGVILITTKRGEIGSPKFMLESYLGNKVTYGRLPNMTGEQFAERGRESYRAAGSYTDPGVNDALDKLFFRPVEYNNLKAGKWVDYQDILLQNGKQQKHQLTVMGGSKAIKYNIAGNVLSEEGIVPDSKFERYSLRTNLDLALTSKINMGVSTLLSYNIQSNKSSGALTEALRNSPLGSPNADDGTPRFDPADDGYRVNPMSDYIWDSFRLDNKHWSANINMFGEVKIFPELTYRINLGNEFNLNTIKESAGNFSIFRRGQTTYAQIDNSVKNKKIYESILTYDKIFNTDHHFTVTAVHSIQTSKMEANGEVVSGLPYVISRYDNIGSASVINSVNSNLSEWSLISYVGRLNYVYSSKYLMTLSVRADGASQFSPNHKWGYFPSAALGWRISEEGFIKRAEWISNLKLRLSYGVSGNQAISPYQTQGSLINTTYAWDESAGYGMRPSELSNKNLKWESTSVYNIGLDFGFLNGRIIGNLELYNTNTYDLLMFRKLPITTGFDQVLENVGKTKNKGIELGIHTINIKKPNFNWSSDLSFYLNREQIVELYNGKVDDIGNRWFIGQPIFVYYDFKKIGIWQTEEASTAATFGSKPGDIKLLDRDADGIYTDADRMVVGTREPKFVFDLANSFKYKNWDLSVKTYVRWGNTIAVPALNLQSINRENQFMVDYWTPTNPTNAYPRPDSRIMSYTYGSTLTYRDGSFIRLRQLSLGYTLPKSILDHLKISNARFYITGENLWFWTKSEIRDINMEPESSGDAQTYPATKTYMAGVNITF